ncbi:MAG: hypothetical protein J6W24_08410 [Prevotella sp.]|nr:hypothetical protein [Prevotella sp.]
MTANSKHIIIVALLAIVSAAPVLSASKKEQKALMLQLVGAMERGEKAMKSEVPTFLLDDIEASRYCQEILGKSDEQYAQDTARVNKIVGDALWVMDNCFIPDDEVWEKLKKKGYDIGRLYDCRHWAETFIQSIHPRYDIMTSYCELQLKRRREAMERTMPEGALVKFEYREYGSSRPTEVLITLTRNEDGKWMLNSKEESKYLADWTQQADKEVGEDVSDKIRQIAEQSKLYQCLNIYEEQPAFDKAPHLMGGPPSWSFRCEFEGGTISSRSECMPVPMGCAEIVDYLGTIQK